ncbi:hypothetical protein F7725_017286, partial [Dissostichus mawsoni]
MHAEFHSHGDICQTLASFYLVDLFDPSFGRIINMIKTMLIPQFLFLGMGLTGATFYLIRLARGPHVTLWDKKNNPEPWNNLDPTYQYK